MAIGVANVPIFAKLTRAAANGVLAREFALAARAAGRGPLAIAFDHVLPNIAPPLIVQATIQFAIAILAEAALSYLGLGAQPPLVVLGADARRRAGLALRRAAAGDLSRPRGRASRCSASICSATACATRSIRNCGRGAEMLLEVDSLAIDLPTPRGPRRVVRDVSFALDRGESARRRRRIRARARR